MTQHIDIEFRERATSEALNKRFRDITGPCVLAGYRLQLGSEDFTVTLSKGGYTSSVAISPSGAKIEEDQDVMDVVNIEPNDLNEGNPRVDSIYLVYQFGQEGIPATYVVVPGTGGSTTPAPNPNRNTHLLLGYVNVPPMGVPFKQTDLTSRNLGINTLEVANSAIFRGTATFKEEVIFEKQVRFLDGTTGAEDPNSSFIEKLSYPIIAKPGQQTFKVPTPYTPKKKTLFVHKDWLPQPESEYAEVDSTTFKFHDPLKGGEKIWFFWFRNISLYTPEEHQHDEFYYRKSEVNNRSLHHSEDYFGGPSGRVISHYLGTTNYVVIPPVPTDKAADVGEISVEKRANEIVVFNTGTYRGKFDIAYYVKQSYQYVPNDEDIGFFDIYSSDMDMPTYTWKKVQYKRKNGTLYMETNLENYDARGYFRRMRIDFYNTAGTDIIKTERYALDYDPTTGLISSKVLIPQP
ncbi:hypothetical protein AAXE64_27510 [Priestia megaterium]